jgi:hypothetical protein
VVAARSPQASELEASTGAGALEYEFRPPERLGPTLVARETFDHRPMRRGAVTRRTASGDFVESCIEALERKSVCDNNVARKSGTIHHARSTGTGVAGRRWCAALFRSCMLIL